MLRVSKHSPGFNRGAPAFFVALALVAATYIAEPAEAQMSQALLKATTTGSAGEVTRILSAGAKVNDLSEKGETALMIASGLGRLEVVKALLNKGADVNQRCPDGNWTALYTAAEEGHSRVVRSLLERGASVDDWEPGGWTVLMVASEKGHFEVVKALLEKGAKVNDVSNDGAWTALKIAQIVGHRQIVELLKKYGAVE